MPRTLYSDLITYLSLKGIQDGKIGLEMCYQEYQTTAATIRSIWTSRLQSEPNGGDACPCFYMENGHWVIYTCHGKHLIFSVCDLRSHITFYLTSFKKRHD